SRRSVRKVPWAQFRPAGVEIPRYRQIGRLNFSDKSYNLDYSTSVLPHWFDLHALQLTVAGLAVVCAISAVRSLALGPVAMLRFGLALVFAVGAIGLVAYSRGPLQRAETTCHYRFLRSNLVIDGCVHARSAAAPGTAAPTR